VPHAPVPAYFEVSTSIGIFVSTGSIPLELSQLGEVIVRIRAMTPGPSQNAAGTVTTGTLTTAAPNINAEVLICGGQFCGGAAEESCEDFRKRYLNRLAYHPRATMAWIKEKFLEFPCATRVCVRATTIWYPMVPKSDHQCSMMLRAASLMASTPMVRAASRVTS